MKKIIVVLVLIFIFGCGDPVTTVVTPHPNLSNIVKGADRLAATQNNDGGWDWENPDTDLTSVSPLNTLGVTALGLLDAYKITGDVEYLNACIKTADRLHALIDNADSTFRLRGSDINFLVNMSVVTGDGKYANDAKDGYVITLANYGPDATAFATYLFNPGYSRPYADWDINLYVQGLVMMNAYFPGQGYDVDAKAMAAVMYNNVTVVYNLNDTSQVAYWLVVSASIDTFKTVGLYSTEIDILLPILRTGQQSNGSFLDAGYGEDSQATAYAVMALKKVGESSAAKRGVDYLVNAQLSDGGWTEDSGIVENTENTSEAIQSLM